jgi:hypothetical protein
MNQETQEKIADLKRKNLPSDEFARTVQSWKAEEGSMRITTIKDFVSKQDCEKIINFFNKQEFQNFNGASKFIGKTFPWLQCRSLPHNHEDEHIVKIMSSYRFNATMHARKFFEKELYPEYTDLVVWKNGEDMAVHADSCEMDGTPRDSRGSSHDWRFGGGVLYLNDDYAGGETYFPKYSIQVRPEVGKLSLFMADWNHMHGVREISQGNEPVARYTMPIWFTEDYRKSEI